MEVELKENADVYDKLCAFYDKMFFCLIPGHKKAGRYIKKNSLKNVLEVGFGTGLSLKHYSPGTKVTGIDMSSGMLAVADKKLSVYPSLEVELKEMDAQNLEFKDGQFDCTYAPSLLSIVPNPGKLMKEMIRVTRKGGKIIVISHLQKPGLADALFSKVSTPLTLKLFGFRTDLPSDILDNVEGTKVVEKKQVNRVGPFHLSHLVILEKI